MTKILQVPLWCFVLCILFLKINDLSANTSSIENLVVQNIDSKVDTFSKGDSFYYFQRTGLKLNLFCYFGAGIEFPISKRSSLELFFRYYTLETGSVLGNYYKTNFRVNYKYHIPSKHFKRPRRTYFAVTGMHLKHRLESGYKNQNLYVEDTYLINYGILGLGIRGKRLELWLAGETALNYITNTSTSYQNYPNNPVVSQQDNRWFKYGLSGGLSLYLFQSKKTSFKNN